MEKNIIVITLNTQDGTLVRKSMIMNTSGKYELEEDTIEEKKYLLLERK